MTLSLENIVSTFSLPELEDTDAVRRAGNAYARNSAREICALSLSKSELQGVVLNREAAGLRHLYLNDNEALSELRFEMPLPALEQLYASRCALKGTLEIPGGCLALKQLYLAKNKLGSLVFAGDCPELELLDATGNQIKAFELPEGFGKLAYVYLGENGMENFSLVYSLPSLETLDITENRLIRLPDVLVEQIIDSKTNLNSLYMAGNTPKDIPSVFLGEPERYVKQNCIVAARIWFTELKSAPSEPNKAVKLMLIGNGNAGKSTLLCALNRGSCGHNDEFHPTTHGVHTEVLKHGEAIWHVWDFGGQEVYHSTHRLFMGSPALQVIVFDPETEQSAKSDGPVDGRLPDEKVWNHELPYWFETTFALSPGSRYFVVQNKEDKGAPIDAVIRQYAEDKGAEFCQVSAKTGRKVGTLKSLLDEALPFIPEYDMLMPQSWLKVRQFFIDNLAHPVDNEKLMTRARFEALCRSAQVNPDLDDMLLEYLHHSGYLYTNAHLGDQIIADQRWALNAIYKPLERGTPHYREFKSAEGKIRVERLFEVWDRSSNAKENPYTDAQKWLFLQFMESCRLCFRLNNKPWQEENDESDIYVFPEFLPADKLELIEELWSHISDAVAYKLKLPWNNYYIIQSFITRMGRKTETKHLWRNGIHLKTPKGCFMVQLDYQQKAILLSIQKSAEQEWLIDVMEALEQREIPEKWQQLDSRGKWKSFDKNEWKTKQKTPHESMEGEHPGKEMEARTPDVVQELDRPVLLFLSASPASERLSCGEFQEIIEAFQDKPGSVEIKSKSKITTKELSKIIRDYKPNMIHFCGHGKEYDGKGTEGIMFISDDHTGTKLMNAEQLGKIFQSLKQDIPGLHLVMLNACFSEPQAIQISHANIHTIGVNTAIASTAAKAFSLGFYTSFIEEKQLHKAIRLAREIAWTEEADIETMIHVFHNGNKLDLP